MTLFDDPRPDDDPSAPYEPDGTAQRREPFETLGKQAPALHVDGRERAPGEQVSAEPGSTPLAGDPITYAGGTVPPKTPASEGGRYMGEDTPASEGGRYTRALPGDLRIPWSWAHFVVFVFFTFASFIVVQTGLALYYAPRQQLTKEQYERYLLNKPEFLFGSNLIWYALIFLFLYVTLSVLRELPFWSTLGWNKLKLNPSGKRNSPWIYFFSGVALAIFVAVASSRVHTNENMPIQELLKNRDSALLLMGMAVLVAPVVEETVFRGYLYPLFAKSFGIVPGILLTGLLFGLMHGSQLGWSWGIVALLVLVGVIFTSARAYTGTVLASFLLHLGYNSAIAVTTIIGTHGFTRIPPGP
jgi:membrane protease YdiL (CAAX protease family)